MEELLHYVWEHRLFQKDLKTTDGLSIEVIDVGLHNTNDGADFFNAKIKIDDHVWAGNIEIHKKSSDWKKHKHDLNPVYNTVILHIVEIADCDIFSSAGDKIPQCEINYPKHIKDNAEYLLFSNISTPCSNYIRTIPQIYVNGWINSLLLERLERKSNDIASWLKQFNGSWDDVFYVLLTRSFGFGLNSDSFEQLALSLPLRYIQKQRNNIEEIEALLFGQAGMLDNIEKEDNHTKALKQEYNNLKVKYSLTPLKPYIFRKMSIRPGSHPHIRLAQLAALLYKEDKLFSKIVTCSDAGRIRLMLHENASEYWQTHYSFGEESLRKSKFVGDASLDILIINAVVPLLFTYGKYIGDEALCDRAISFLETIKAESNSITRDFKNAGLHIQSAYDSQAAIQLKREYCEKRKCLFCRIGYNILTEGNTQP